MIKRGNFISFSFFLIMKHEKNKLLERHDHRAGAAHSKEILSVSGSRELKLFCSASLDESIRIWNDKCDLIRVSS